MCEGGSGMTKREQELEEMAREIIRMYCQGRRKEAARAFKEVFIPAVEERVRKGALTEEEAAVALALVRTLLEAEVERAKRVLAFFKVERTLAN